MSIDRSNLASRIWARDHTVWKPDPAEISNRLGWLDVMGAMRERAPGLRAFADAVVSDGIRTVVLLGMGGSSLAPEVLRETFGSTAIELIVLDTTHPAAVARVEASLDLDATLFIVASKSGSTIETRSHMAYFSHRAKPDRFVAITDPGTSLEAHARDAGFREVFLNPPDIGGRYSALSLFGLVPAALLGVDLDVLLGAAEAMAEACRAEDGGPGASLGIAIGEAARGGGDKLTLRLPPALASLGVWIEQLVAESSGKEGRGIVPVVDEPALDEYGSDRTFVVYGDQSAPSATRLPDAGSNDLGAEFFRWEFATAVACAVLGVNAFDQPNVEEAKKAAGEILAEGAGQPGFDDVEALLGSVQPGDYIAIQAYLDPTPDNTDMLRALRARLGRTYGVATTLGFGPRFLHSTGQLHKGGANSVVCLQVVDRSRDVDVEIPGAPYTFGALLDAQALGDLRALRARGRRVARTSLDM